MWSIASPRKIVLDHFHPFARAHQAESVEILGALWYNKACRSDREAACLINSLRSKPKQTEVYCYLEGGGGQ